MKIVQGYKKLKVYNLAHELAIRVHTMSLKLPRFELFEEGGASMLYNFIEAIESKHDPARVGKINQ